MAQQPKANVIKVTDGYRLAAQAEHLYNENLKTYQFRGEVV